MSVFQLCAVAMLIAVTVVLSQVSGYLRIGNISKFSVSFISIYIAAAAFGPFIGGLVGALADVISYVANPTGAYIFWFTLISFVNGFIFGLFFYRCTGEKEAFWRFALKAVLCSAAQLAINMIFRTYILVKLGFLPQSFASAFFLRLPGSLTMAVIKVPVLIALESFVPQLVTMLHKGEKVRK